MVNGCSLGEVSVLESGVVVELDSVDTVPGIIIITLILNS